MELSQILSWIGSTTGMFIGIPQLAKTIRTKKVGDLSVTMFIMSLITCICFLVRAMAIRETAFMLYYSILILINVLQIFLIWKYQDRKIAV